MECEINKQLERCRQICVNYRKIGEEACKHCGEYKFDESSDKDAILVKYEDLIHFVIEKQFPFFRYTSKGMNDYDDAVQYGYLGLLRAIETFNPETSTFMTWAYNCIFHSIMNGTNPEKTGQRKFEYNLGELDFTNTRFNSKSQGSSNSNSEYDIVSHINKKRYGGSLLESVSYNDNTDLSLMLDDFKSRLKHNDLIIFEGLLNEIPQTTLAKELNVSRQRIAQRVINIRRRFRAYFGEDFCGKNI